MFSFIRKRLPSKDRSNVEQQQIKDQQEMKKIQMEKDLSHQGKSSKNKSKNKSKSTNAIDELVLGRKECPSVEKMNESYSEVDYFPLMSQQLTHSKSSESLNDCYVNPSELLQSNSPPIDIPVIFVDRQLNSTKYKDLDHLKTRALNEVAQQRFQMK